MVYLFKFCWQNVFLVILVLYMLIYALQLQCMLYKLIYFLKQSTVVFSVSQNDSFIIKVIHHQKLRADLSCTQILVMDQFVKLSLVLIMTLHVFTVYSQEWKWLFRDLKKMFFKNMLLFMRLHLCFHLESVNFRRS